MPLLTDAQETVQSLLAEDVNFFHPRGKSESKAVNL